MKTFSRHTWLFYFLYKLGNLYTRFFDLLLCQIHVNVEGTYEGIGY